MLVFALMLIAGGLVVAVSLIVFFAENLFALLCAILAGKAALATGGGWPGALVAAALIFALVSVGLRLAILLTRSIHLRLLLASLIIVPAALLTFLFADGILWPFVPAPVWRMSLAVIAAVAVAAGAGRRLWASRPAA